MPEYKNNFMPGEKIQCDICIIGAGAAGITLARELSDLKAKTCIVEAGSYDFSEETQNLYKGENVGLNYYELDECRLRFFGGTTNHWNGLCGPLHEEDFYSHKWIKDSGWPIAFHVLKKYYERAQRICELGPMNYTPEDWVEQNLPKFDGEKIEIGLSQLSVPTRFGERYKNDLQDSKNLRIILNANLISLIPSRDLSRIISAKFKNLNNDQVVIAAKIYVLACGGIENARMLLLPNNYSSVGIGNSEGLVGKYFMEHITWNPATIVLTNEKINWWRQFEEQTNTKYNQEFMLFLSTNFAMREKHKILNYCFYLYPHYHSLSTWSAAKLKKLLITGKTGGFWEHLSNTVSGADEIIKMIFRRFLNEKDLVDRQNIELLKPIIQVEQAPNKESCVRLSPKKDKLGVNTVLLDWKLSEIDKRTIKIATTLMAEEIGRLGLGRTYLTDWIEDIEGRWPPDIQGGSHHMGTTRMSDSPKMGVVDKNSKVYGVSNLFIAGSSVFPTVGYANPTLTIVALSIRLAEYLKKNMTNFT
ncbi:MAG: Oxygen-dependent choline dehydrogenase [Alphaproteobacteria bacterium MarineAlpha3_Bin7]|nr:MAG: Oxygen-dependent choline dehydrogenase [Alphaproteobacteria bacterium MarineAlpha3_Bin7]|tara:strand:+ start:614 stop:2203 length:1590 start_codon:yes stop_codon:yes gene_type:complete